MLIHLNWIKEGDYQILYFLNLKIIDNFQLLVLGYSYFQDFILCLIICFQDFFILFIFIHFLKIFRLFIMKCFGLRIKFVILVFENLKKIVPYVSLLFMAFNFGYPIIILF